jgi:hypothetical protein
MADPLGELCNKAARLVHQGVPGDNPIYDTDDLSNDLYVFALETDFDHTAKYALKNLIQQGYRLNRKNRPPKGDRDEADVISQSDAIQQMVDDGVYPRHYWEALQKYHSGVLVRSHPLVDAALTRIQEMHRVDEVSLQDELPGGEQNEGCRTYEDNITYSNSRVARGPWDMCLGWESVLEHQLFTRPPVTNAVLELTDKQRLFVYLRYYANLPWAQLSPYLGYVPSKLRQRSHDCLFGKIYCSLLGDFPTQYETFTRLCDPPFQFWYNRYAIRQERFRRERFWTGMLGEPTRRWREIETHRYYLFDEPPKTSSPLTYREPAGIRILSTEEPVGCPTCDAQPNNPCVMFDGVAVSWVHARRGSGSRAAISEATETYLSGMGETDGHDDYYDNYIGED